MNGIRRRVETEPCGTCGRAVEVGRWTTRSRYSGKVLCDDHGTVPYPFPDARWDAVARSYGPRPSRTPVTADAVANAYVDDLRARRAAEPPELRAQREAYVEWTKAGGSADEFFERWDAGEWEERDEPLPWYEARARGGAEIRSRCVDGTPLYGPEPDGVPRHGRSYEERWWVPDGVETRDVDRVYDFAGGLA